jgi:hypothetical protein
MLMNLHKKNWIDKLTLRWGTNTIYTEILLMTFFLQGL